MGPPLGQAMEFLSQALSQRGPKAVPYPENYKYSIREHVSDLLKVPIGMQWHLDLARAWLMQCIWCCRCSPP
jgi:hypothetical protein